mmetsp:Transcript_8969/g.21865  ORF Transcript_8969/g.21865 Transcript_8969/m.21865 type:complete len:266 (-) Transcript_8969:36-833(-)|eukprot:g14848.t1
MQKRKVGVEIIYDYDEGKYYKFNQNNGDTALCDVQGKPVPQFYRDYSGFATVLDRKEDGRIDEVPVLGTLEDIPKYIGRPAKYVGYQQVPRPGIKMAAASDECAYTMPTYLEPIPPKLGKVSLKVKTDTRPKFLPAKVRALPSFLHTLDSQYAESLSLNHYLNKTFSTMRNSGDVAALKAENKATVMNDGIDLMGELRKHRMDTKGKFASKRPPYTGLEIKNKEKARDRKMNPRRAHLEDMAYEEDVAAVNKRRRDRYMRGPDGK